MAITKVTPNELDLNGSVAVVANVVTASVLGAKIVEYDNTISANYTISSNKNAISYGPLAISNNVTVAIPTGSTWNIL